MTRNQALEYAQERANRLGGPVYVWYYGYRWWTADETNVEDAICVMPNIQYTEA